MNNFLDDIIDPLLATRHVSQNTDEWDKIRAGRFTASRMSELMAPGYRPMTQEELKARPKTGTGSKVTRALAPEVLADSAMNYIKEKVAEVLAGMPKPSSYAYPIVYGKEMEPRAIEYFSETTGLKVEPVGFVTFGDHAGGSPDGLVGEEDILEVKCPYAIDTQIDYLMLTDQWDVQRMYPAYYWQCQSNLLFTGRKRCHFVTYDPNYLSKEHKMTHIIIEANSAEHDLICKKIALAVEEKLKLISLLTKKSTAVGA